MAVGLKEVSQLAKVSVSTVSHILSGRKSRYSQKTRDRVYAAARKLEYKPNPISQALRTNRTKTIGVIVHTTSEPIRFIEDLASRNGYQLLLAFTKWKSSSYEMEIRNLLHRKVDGLLLLSPAVDTSRNEAIEELVRKQFPLVGIGVSLARGMDYVDWDRTSAYEQLCEHLLLRGCRRFLFLHTSETPAVSERIRGVQSALSKLPDTELKTMFSNVGEILTEPVAQTISSGWPDAIVCQTDLLALAAMKHATNAGMAIPNDMAVTGCSNMDFTPLLNVPLTTIRMPIEKMVSIAMTHLFDKMENKDDQSEQLSMVIQPELILRKSDQFTGKPQSA